MAPAPPPPPPNQGPKTNYRCTPVLQKFYSGGAFAAASDGSFLACACDEKIKLVNSDGSIRATLEGDTESVTALAIGPGDRFLFSASHSRLIRVWDLSTLKCIRSWKGHDGPVMGMACHASGVLLATRGADTKVCVWDVEGGFCTHFFRGHQAAVTIIAFNPDPNSLQLFSGDNGGSVRVWNLESKKCVAVLKKEDNGSTETDKGCTVTSLALSEDGHTLLSAGKDKIVNVWDMQNYSLKTTVLTYEEVETVCIINFGTGLYSCLDSCELAREKRKTSGTSTVHFLTVGERGVVRIWSSEGAVCIYEQPSSDATLGFKAAVVLPSDQGLLCVTADQFLFFCSSKSPEGTFQLNLYKRLVGYDEEIYDAKFLGEDEQHLAVVTNLAQVQVFDVATMSCSYVLAGHTKNVMCIDTCLSSSGRTLVVTGSKDNTVRLWEVESRYCIGIGRGHLGDVGAVAFSKKQKNFFVSGSCDCTIKVWSLDGVSEDSNQETVLKAKAVVAAHDKDINCLAVSPNDSLVCSGSEDRTASIWRLPDLVSVVVLKGHKRGIWSVEFSPVDQCVITSSGDRTIKVWAVTDGSCLKSFEGHTSSVLRASFLTRGTQIVSCGGDGLVKLWNVKTEECIATYDQHEGKVWALAVGKKTELLATGDTDATLYLWHDSTSEDKKEALCKEEETILRSQELDNAVSDADYAKAIQIAFELRRPHKLFDLFSQLCRRSGLENPIEKALTTLGKEELHVLFEYVREWNTKPKLCHVAQFVLNQILKIFPPSEIMEIKGISELLEGLIPYSQRHFSRIDRLVRSTYLLDFILTRMSVIEAPPSSKKDHERPLENSAPDDNLLPDTPVLENSCQDDTVVSPKLENMSSKKRKPSKSKRASGKKLKSVSQQDRSTVSVEG